MAVLYEDVACIKKLMYNKEHPCDPKIYTLENMSPLHLACRETELEIVELIYQRMKSLEMKESIDSMINEYNTGHAFNKDNQVFKELFNEIGVKTVKTYPKHISILMKQLHKTAKERNPENYRQVKKIIDDKFNKAMGQTDIKMRAHLDKVNYVSLNRITTFKLHYIQSEQ